MEALADGLTCQERRLAVRRERIMEVLSRGGDLTRSKEQAAAFVSLEAAAGPDHPGLERERIIAQVIERVVGDDQAPAAWQTYEQVLSDRGLTDAMLEASRRFEELAGMDPQDPAIEALAREGGSLGEAVKALLPGDVRHAPGDPEVAEILLRALTAGMGSAQARCVELLFATWREQSS